jgi:hypothetical protein
VVLRTAAVIAATGLTKTNTMSIRGLAWLKRAVAAPLLAAALPLTALAQMDREAAMSSALDLIVAARAVEASQAAGQLDVRIGSKAPKLLLRKVVLRIDDAAPLSYEYSDLEVQAMQAGGLHPFASLRLTPGVHRLRAEFIAREPDAAPTSPRVRQYLDRQLQFGGEPLQLQLELVPETLRTRGELQLATQAPGADGGAASLRSAQFLAASERHLAAAIEYLSLQSRGIALPYDAQQRLADSLSRAGLARRAGAATAADTARYQSYNQGAGNLDAQSAGAVALQAIGSGDARDGAGLALRDQANVTLGFHHLRQRDGRAAVDAFNRVRSPGPFSNPALLGLGWAYLLPSSRPAAEGAAPPSSRQDYVMPASEDELAEMRRRTPFRRMQSVATGALEEDLRRALVPWIELIGRDPLDAAVQEGMLAIPYAIDHLGAHQDAQKYYLRAVNDLERARNAVKRAQADVADGALAAIADSMDDEVGNGWHWWLADLPDGRWWRDDLSDAPPSFFIKPLLARVDFVVALESYRDLHLLLSQLERHAAALGAVAAPQAAPLKSQIEALRPQLAAVAAAQRRSMEAVANAELKDLLMRTERYLVEARLAIARTHDRAVEGEQP